MTRTLCFIVFIHATMGCKILPIASQLQNEEGGSFQSTGESVVIVNFDVSGTEGRDGRAGDSYPNPPAGYGTDGRRGGDATPSTRGQDAGQVNFRLGYRDLSRNTGTVVIDGWIQNPGENQQETVNQAVRIGEQGFIYVNARGGDGGRGGRGGDGQPGSRGSDGADATRYSDGQNGGRGGDGGDAGNPTDGSDAGNSGRVRIEVTRENTGLVMLVKGNLQKGIGGRPGSAGTGGKGGAGGSGGSSYSWTETETYTDTETDAQGNTKTVTKTRTTYHSNPGGSSGSSGNSGRGSSYVARGGRPGDIGTLEIEVVNADGTSDTYHSPFDLALESYEVVGETDILEPDSEIKIEKLTIKNSGGMPTPDNYTMRFYLNSDRWVLADGVDLVLHKALQPGESYTFDSSALKFRLGDHVIRAPSKKPFFEAHELTPLSKMESGINRPFRDFRKMDILPIQFPIQLTAIEALNSLAPGESTRIIWGVKNIGSETFDNNTFYRAVRTQLMHIATDIDPNLVVFFDDTGQQFDLIKTPFLKELSGLKPGETRIIETRVGVKDGENLKAYQSLILNSGADLQRPHSSANRANYRSVDMRQFEIRIAQRYKRTKGAGFLLIANHKTTTAEVEEWTKLADYFGSKLDVWDVSYYGFLDLSRAIHEDRNLLAQWQGQTIIMPNNFFDAAGGETHSFELLARRQFLEAASEYDINFYVVGEGSPNGESILGRALIPLDDGDRPTEYKNVSGFINDAKRWSHYVAQSQEMVGDINQIAQGIADAGLGSFIELHINKRTFLFQPSEKWLEDRAERLNLQLRKVDPLHRWHIVHRYDTGETDTSWGFFKRRQIGTFELRKSLDSSKGSVVLYEVSESERSKPGFINSRENKHGIFLTMKFEDKVDRFVRLCAERIFPRASESYIDRPLSDAEVQEIGLELMESILTDLYNEQAVARRAQTWGRSGVGAQLPKLNYLHDRTFNYGLTFDQIKDHPESVQLLYKLIASMNHLARSARTVGDMLVFPILPLTFFKRSRVISAYMLDKTDSIARSIFGPHQKWWERIGQKFAAKDPFTGKAATKENGLARREAHLRILELERSMKGQHPEDLAAAQNHAGLAYDPELLSDVDWVQSGEEYDKVVAQEGIAQTKREVHEREVLDQRRDLLVPLCEQMGTQMSKGTKISKPKAQP